MAFGVGKNIAVLESKLDIYEDLSQQMLEKLERAVGEISSNSNKHRQNMKMEKLVKREIG